MRASGSPRVAVVCSQMVYTPDDLGLNNVAYPVVPGFAASQTVLIEGYGIWSVYIQVTGLGNVNLEVTAMQETDETVELATFVLTGSLTSGAVRHYAFGPVGSIVAFVARRVRLKVAGQTAVGNVTARMFGRAY